MIAARLMLDLCCGLKGASAAFRDAGWDVVTLDIDPQFEPDIVADLRTWSWDGPRPTLVWASIPCDEFAREFMPWSATGRTPDLSLYRAYQRIVKECQPDYNTLENVKGALWYFGPAQHHIGPFYFWGNFPCPGQPKFAMRKKESMSSSWHAERAKIPYEISQAFLRAVETQKRMVLA